MKIDQWNTRIEQVFFLYNTWVNALNADPVSTSIADQISMLSNPDSKVHGGPAWGPSGADRIKMGPVLAPWTSLSGNPQPSVNNNADNDV